MNIRKNMLFLSLCAISYLSFWQTITPVMPHQQTIKIGQSACFTGSLGLYGNMIKHAINARIQRINKSGGIHGKLVELVSIDDDSDPHKTYLNTKKMTNDGIHLFLGNTGTRSVLRLLPLIKDKKIAMLFPWSGDPQLNDPSLSHIINGPGLLSPQVHKLAHYLCYEKHTSHIAVFHADDDFSSSAAQDFISSLKTYNTEPVAVASYNRFTLDIVTPAKKLLAADPRVVVCIATSMPTVKLINHFFAAGHYGTTFCGVDSTLFTGIIAQGRGVDFMYTSAVPHPTQTKMLLARNYCQDMKTYFPEEPLNVLSFSYYLSAAITLQAMNNIEGEITPQAVIQEIEALHKTSIEDFPITFNHQNRHAFGETIEIIYN